MTIEDLYEKVKKPNTKAPPPPVIEGDFSRVPAITSPDQAPRAEILKPRIPFGPLRKLAPSRLNTRRDLLEQLNASLPLNDSDMPDFVYRPDLLDVEAFRKLADPDVSPETVAELQSMLDAATVQLKFHEGFPSLPNGTPFWSQLDYEPTEAHQAFLEYQRQGGVRSLEELGHDIRISMSDLLDWFHMYFWNFRVTAFDMFKVIRHQRLKLLRALNMEDNHFQVAEQLMGQLSDHFRTEEFSKGLAGLDPDKAVAMLEKVTKLQRISVGLGEKGGFSDEIEPPRIPTVEIAMRQMAIPKEKESATDEEDFDLLVESPDNIDIAQELIIRMNAPKK